MSGGYVTVAENEKHTTFWEDVAEKKKQREEAVRKQKEQLEELQEETQRLAAELEVQQRGAEQEMEAEADRRHQEQVIALQIEKDRLTAELDKYKQTQNLPQNQLYSYSPSDYETMKKTVYGHACSDPKEAQMGVAFVILNRAKTKAQRGELASIDEICREPGQFWFGIYGEPEIHNWDTYNCIDEWLPGVIKGEGLDLTNGAYYFLTQAETHHDWLKNLEHVATHGRFNFYK